MNAFDAAFKTVGRYGAPPVTVGRWSEIELPEVMYYLYLPIAFPFTECDFPFVRLPENLKVCTPLITAAMEHAAYVMGKGFRYVYLSARKGWATRDNPLNRPGWHCDGFGTDDLNYVWWKGPGTRFLVDPPIASSLLDTISDSHVVSLAQFETLANMSPQSIRTPPQGHLYAIDPYVIHATPEISTPCMRQYVKISMSDHKYNLKDNSHNHLFDYRWEMFDREEVRNDTSRAQRDYV